MVLLWKDYAYYYVLFCQLLTTGMSQQENAYCNVLVLIISEILTLFAVSKNVRLSTMLSLLVKFASKTAA